MARLAFFYYQSLLLLFTIYIILLLSPLAFNGFHSLKERSKHDTELALSAFLQFNARPSVRKAHVAQHSHVSWLPNQGDSELIVDIRPFCFSSRVKGSSSPNNISSGLCSWGISIIPGRGIEPLSIVGDACHHDVTVQKGRVLQR